MYAHSAAARRHLCCTCPCRGVFFGMSWCHVELEEDARVQHSASSAACAKVGTPASRKDSVTSDITTILAGCSRSKTR